MPRPDPLSGLPEAPGPSGRDRATDLPRLLGDPDLVAGSTSGREPAMTSARLRPWMRSAQPKAERVDDAAPERAPERGEDQQSGWMENLFARRRRRARRDSAHRTGPIGRRPRSRTAHGRRRGRPRTRSPPSRGRPTTARPGPIVDREPARDDRRASRLEPTARGGRRSRVPILGILDGPRVVAISSVALLPGHGAWANVLFLADGRLARGLDPGDRPPPRGPEGLLAGVRPVRLGLPGHGLRALVPAPGRPGAADLPADPDGPREGAASVDPRGSFEIMKAATGPRVASEPEGRPIVRRHGLGGLDRRGHQAVPDRGALPVRPPGGPGRLGHRPMVLSDQPRSRDLPRAELPDLPRRPSNSLRNDRRPPRWGRPSSMRIDRADPAQAFLAGSWPLTQSPSSFW